MMTQTTIILVDDDEDDYHFISAAMAKSGLENKLLWFGTAHDALHYLKEHSGKAFLILCDVNMPVMDGFEFKQELNSDAILVKYRIPFVFLSTAAELKHVKQSLVVKADGYFQKPNDLSSLSGLLVTIVDYWKKSVYCQYKYEQLAS